MSNDLTKIHSGEAVNPAHGSAEEFATSEDPHCKDGGKACLNCLMLGACLLPAADDERGDDDETRNWNTDEQPT